MNISLLNQNIVIACSIVVTAAWLIIIHRLNKKWISERGLLLVIVSILVGLGITQYINYEYSGGNVPSLLWLMLFPFTFSLVLIIPAWRNARRWLKYSALLTTIFGLFFSLVIINGYYGFYPTLDSVFNVATTDTANAKIISSQSLAKKLPPTIEGSIFTNDTSVSGVVKNINIPGTISHFAARSAYVYLPPIAQSPADIKLPVIVLTSGLPGIPGNWVNNGLPATMDAFARLHHGITPIVFMVDNTGSLTNDTECVNSPRGNVETYLTVDVPNYIKAHYDVASSGNQWALGGLSLGGTCSLILSLRHPSIYHTLIDLSGEVGPEIGSEAKTVQVLFGGSMASYEAHEPLLLLKKHPLIYKGMTAFYGVGNGDNPAIVAGLKEVYKLSKADGMNTTFEEVNGSHTFTVWQELFKDALPGISNRLGATVSPQAKHQ